MKYMILLVIFFSISISGYATETKFKCATCHENVSEILPAKHIKKKSFDGCFTCHKDGGKVGSLSEKIHTQHLADMGTDTETCISCHPKAGDEELIVNEKTGKKVYTEDASYAFASYHAIGTLANSHNNAGVNCSDCHTTYDYDEVDNMHKKCKSCHDGYAEIMESSHLKSGEKPSPHKSHIDDIDCTKCHSLHNEFKNLCAQCHSNDFDFKWEQKLKE